MPVFYFFLKMWVRIGLHFYCSSIKIRQAKNFRFPASAILACNHPNSFLDAMIIGAFYPRTLHFLARGDAFKNPSAARILRAMHLIPIFRLSEGKENLSANDQSFLECLKVLENGGSVLIFSEGICVNEWKLRALKKGTARLAFRAWNELNLSEMEVQTMGISYSSYDAVPKQVFIQYGAAINHRQVTDENEAAFYKNLNGQLRDEIEKCIVSKEASNQPFTQKKLRRTLLFAPAAIAWLSQYWLYYLLRKIAKKKTAGSVFFDSVLFGLLLIVYPLFLILVSGFLVFFSGQIYWLSALIVLPLLTWCYKWFVA